MKCDRRERYRGIRRHTFGLAMLAVACGLFSTPARLKGQEPPIEDFSPGFLGMYRKVMELEPHIQRFSRQVPMLTSIWLVPFACTSPVAILGSPRVPGREDSFKSCRRRTASWEYRRTLRPA